MIVRERKIDFALPDNQNDHPVTISRKHIMIAGETILISGKPGSNEDESVNHFMKTKTIAGNPKSIFAKIKSKNYFSGNRSCGNILQEAGSKLKGQGIILSEAGNVMKEDAINVMIPGNKLKDQRSVVPEAGNRLKAVEINLKILGKGMIFVETFRKFEE